MFVCGFIIGLAVGALGVGIAWHFFAEPEWNREASMWNFYWGFREPWLSSGFTATPAPEIGERIRVELPGQPGAWVDATVRHVVRGTANCLIGLRLHEKQRLPFSQPHEG